MAGKLKSLAPSFKNEPRQPSLFQNIEITTRTDESVDFYDESILNLVLYFTTYGGY